MMNLFDDGLFIKPNNNKIMSSLPPRPKKVELVKELPEALKRKFNGKQLTDQDRLRSEERGVKKIKSDRDYSKL